MSSVAIVTGASSGIGRETCVLLAARGWKVAALARREPELLALQKELGEEALLPLVCDVTQEDAVARAVASAQEKLGPLSLFVANAGIMKLSHLSLGKLAEWKQMVDVNVNGVLHCAAAVLPVFRERKQGHFIIVSSDADRKVFPGSAVYSGTKAFVSLFAEGMRAELCADGIPVRVTSISSGAVATELASHITDPSIFEGWSKGPAVTPMSAKDVADVIVWAAHTPDNVNINNVMFRPVTQGN